MRRILFHIALFCVLAAAASVVVVPARTTADEAPPRLLLVALAPVELRVVSEQPLPDHPLLRSAYASFVDQKRHIGAFAVAPNGAHGWAHGHLSIAAARDRALAICARYGQFCRIHAIAAPKGVADDTALVASSSVAQALKSLRAHDMHRALAVSEAGHWGTAWGWTTGNQARIRALAGCETQRAERAEPGPPCIVVRPIIFVPEASADDL